MERGQYPAVGDWVLTKAPEQGSELSIARVLPRKSGFSRKVAGERTEEQVVAANVDTVWLVTALDRDYRASRVERYLTLAWESGAQPVVVLTKIDLIDEPERYSAEVERIALGVPVQGVSAVAGRGVDELERYFANHATVALIGSSGVGKSTLINRLLGVDLQPTQSVRGDGKGRHTTVHRQLLQRPSGGLIIDTPGMRELQLWDTATGVEETFTEIEHWASHCRFTDCSHQSEPGCAVQEAVQRGELPAERLASYQKLQRELAHLERKQDALAQREEKQRIKVMMKSMRNHHPKYKRQ